MCTKDGGNKEQRKWKGASAVLVGAWIGFSCLFMPSFFACTSCVHEEMGQPLRGPSLFSPTQLLAHHMVFGGSFLH